MLLHSALPSLTPVSIRRSSGLNYKQNLSLAKEKNVCIFIYSITNIIKISVTYYHRPNIFLYYIKNTNSNTYSSTYCNSNYEEMRVWLQIICDHMG